ncbi:MAG: hypothetical protein JNK11_13085 [Alphaproteobacteria bacterium]|nr:hypothetical protein [Alphaproteobacteria bacterium]
MRPRTARRLGVHALAALALLWAPSSRAGPADGVLSFGIYDVPGFHEVSPGGAVSGRAIAVLARLAAGASLEPRFRALPRARIVPALLGGEIDISLIGEGSQGDAPLIGLGRALRLSVVAIARKGLPLAAADDLRGLRVGARRATSVQRFAPAVRDEDLVEINDFTQSVRLLARGRVDALVTTCQGVEAAAKAEGIARDVLGAFLPLGSLEVHGYAAPGLAGSAKLRRLAAAFATFDWSPLAQASSWCEESRSSTGLDARAARRAPALDG